MGIISSIKNIVSGQAPRESESPEFVARKDTANKKSAVQGESLVNSRPTGGSSFVLVGANQLDGLDKAWRQKMGLS